MIQICGSPLHVSDAWPSRPDMTGDMHETAKKSDQTVLAPANCGIIKISAISTHQCYTMESP